MAYGMYSVPLLLPSGRGAATVTHHFTSDMLPAEHTPVRLGLPTKSRRRRGAQGGNQGRLRAGNSHCVCGCEGCHPAPAALTNAARLPSSPSPPSGDHFSHHVYVRDASPRSPPWPAPHATKHVSTCMHTHAAACRHVHSQELLSPVVGPFVATISRRSRALCCGGRP